MNKQRTVIYAERRRVLEGEDIREQVDHMMSEVVTAYVDGATSGQYAEDWDLNTLWTALRALYPTTIRWQDLAEGEEELTREGLLQAILADIRAAYRQREAELEKLHGPEAPRWVERNVVLSVLDRKWREHLYEMDYLKEGIGLRAMAQRDPLIEYQREGYDMFAAMLDALKEESVRSLFIAQIQVTEAAVTQQQRPSSPAASGLLADAASATPVGNGRAGRPARGERPARAERPADAAPPESTVPPALRAARGLAQPEQSQLTYSGPAEAGGTEVRGAGRHRAGTGTGTGTGSNKEPSRNAPCPCGSGKKYKRCHGAPTTARP